MNGQEGAIFETQLDNQSERTFMMKRERGQARSVMNQLMTSDSVPSQSSDVFVPSDAPSVLPALWKSRRTMKEKLKANNEAVLRAQARASRSISRYIEYTEGDEGRKEI